MGPVNGLLDVIFNSTGYAWIVNGMDVWTGGNVNDPGQAPQLAANGPAVGATSVPALTAAELAPVAQEALAGCGQLPA